MLNKSEVDSLAALVGAWRKEANKAMEYCGIPGFGGGVAASAKRQCADELEALIAELRKKDNGASDFGSEEEVIWRVEIFREADGRFACEFRSGDSWIGGMGNYSSTPVGALAELCSTMIQMDEDDSIDRRSSTPPDGSSPGGSE